MTEPKKSKQIVLDVLDDENTIDSSLIPDQVLNFTPKQPKQYEKKTSQTSNFIITINPNISYRSLQPDQVVNSTKALIAACKNLEINLSNGNLLKDFPSNSQYKMPKLTKFEFAIERGEQNGFVHAHIIAMFSSYTQLRLGVMKDFINSMMSKYSKGCYVNVVNFKDTTATIQNYIKKHSNAVYSTMVQDAQSSLK